MNKLILIISFFIISCTNTNHEKTYENSKIKVIYKENNKLLSEKLLDLQFGSNDTILKSINYSLKAINDLFIISLRKTKKETRYLQTGKFDMLIIKKDMHLKTNEIYHEFEKFLLKDSIIEFH